MYKDLYKSLLDVERGLCSQRGLPVKYASEGLGVRPDAEEPSGALCSALVLQAQQPDIWGLPWSSLPTR